MSSDSKLTKAIQLCMNLPILRKKPTSLDTFRKAKRRRKCTNRRLPDSRCHYTFRLMFSRVYKAPYQKAYLLMEFTKIRSLINSIPITSPEATLLVTSKQSCKTASYPLMLFHHTIQSDTDNLTKE